MMHISHSVKTTLDDVLCKEAFFHNELSIFTSW